MEYSNKTFKKELLALADKKYKEFSEKLGTLVFVVAMSTTLQNMRETAKQDITLTE